MQDSTKSDILLNYEKDDTIPAIISGFMALAVSLCLPINLYPLRELIDGLIPPCLPSARFVLVTIGILAASAGISFVVPNLGDVFDLTGATGCMFVCYLLPCMFLAKLEGHWRCSSMLVVLIGVPASIISLWKIIPELV